MLSVALVAIAFESSVPKVVVTVVKLSTIIAAVFAVEFSYHMSKACT